MVEEAALLLTPSRHNNEEEVKRTSLFNNEPATTTTPKCALEIDLSDKCDRDDDDISTSNVTNNNKNIISDDVMLEELPCTPPVTDNDEKIEMAANLTPPDDEDVFENNVVAEVESLPSVGQKVDQEVDKDLQSTSRVSGDSQVNDVVCDKTVETEAPPDDQVSGKDAEPTKKFFMQFLSDHQPELSTMSEDELFELNTKLESIKTEVFKEIFKRASLK